MDHIEWDLLSPLTPEAFAIKLCADIGLTGEAAPLIAHAMHEEILKHKKDAIEWGMIGGDAGSTSNGRDALEDDKRDKSGLGLVKDKTGLGLGPGAWGRAPRDGLGRGPRALKSVWKDWNDAEEYATRFEVLSLEEVERREIERERASRYVAEYRLCQNNFLKMLKTDDYDARHRNFSSARRVDDGKESGSFPYSVRCATLWPVQHFKLFCNCLFPHSFTIPNSGALLEALDDPLCQTGHTIFMSYTTVIINSDTVSRGMTFQRRNNT